MRPKIRVNDSIICLLTLLLIFNVSSTVVRAQCTAAPIAPAVCTLGNGAASNGITINSGQTYWVNATSTLTTITLSGGTLRICGTLNLNTLQFNSGNFIVEAGGTASVTNISSNLNGNCVFINRGTTTLNGNFTFQNSGNAIYNDLSTSVFKINGTVSDNNSLIVNRGVMTITEIKDQVGSAGNFCVQDQSVSNISKLDIESTDAFTYSGAGSPACVNVTTSATLNHDLTASSKVLVCLAGGVTPGGGAGWGSATVHTNCTSCATILSLGLTGFTAIRQGNTVDLQWYTGQRPEGDEVFYIERSTDGKNFPTLGSLQAVSGEDDYRFTDPALPAMDLYYRVRVVDPQGLSSYTPIALVGTNAGEGFRIYPNPVGAGKEISLVIPSHLAGTARLSLLDIAGQTLRARTVPLANGSNNISWEIPGGIRGIYILHIQPPSGDDLFEKIFVQE